MEKETEALRRKLESTVKHYNFLLTQKDKSHAEQLHKIEQFYRGSWKWKTGDFLVEGFIRIVNFLKAPLKFMRDPLYRGSWNGYNSRVAETGAAAPSAEQVMQEIMSTSAGKSEPGTESNPKNRQGLLLNDTLAWKRASHVGLRELMEKHSQDITVGDGSKNDTISLPAITLLVNICSGFDPGALAKEISRQTFQPLTVILLSENEADEQMVENFLADHPVRVPPPRQGPPTPSGSPHPVRVHYLNYYQNQLAGQIIAKAQCGFYAVWDARDVYGPNYLKDLALAASVSNARIFGKINRYLYQKERVEEANAGEDYRMASGAPVSSLMFRKEALVSFNFLLLLEHGAFYDAFIPEISGLSAMNFIENTSGTAIETSIAESVFV